MNEDNYENEYRSAIKEISRLRSVAREYANFYKMVKEAFEKQDWAAVEAAIAWSDD
jgi:hypothetical protein